MKIKMYGILLLIFVAISCSDDEPMDVREKDPSGKKASMQNVERIALDGMYHLIPTGSSVEQEIAQLGKEIKRIFYTPLESSTLYLFTSDELFTNFARDHYPQLDLNILNEPVTRDAPDSDVSQTEGGRAQTLCLDWRDYNMRFYLSSGPDGYFPDVCSPTGVTNFHDDLFGQVPSAVDIDAPATGTITLFIHAYEDGEDCPFFGFCFAPVIVFVPEGGSATVQNRVYNAVDNRRGESMRWSFTRTPSDDLYLISDGTMYITERSDGSGTPYITGLSQAHIASAGGHIALINNGTLYRLNPYNQAQYWLSNGWQGTEAFTAGKIGSTPFVFAVQGGELWKTNLLTGVSVSMGSGWGGTEVMTFGNGNVFLVWGDQLWKVNASNSATTVIENANWTGTEAMTFHGGYIYSDHQGTLYQTSPNGGSTNLGSGWGGTVAITSYGSNMYALQGGYIWETYTNGSTSNGRGSWPNAVDMTAIKQ